MLHPAIFGDGPAFCRNEPNMKMIPNNEREFTTEKQSVAIITSTNRAGRHKKGQGVIHSTKMAGHHKTLQGAVTCINCQSWQNIVKPEELFSKVIFLC